MNLSDRKVHLMIDSGCPQRLIKMERIIYLSMRTATDKEKSEKWKVVKINQEWEKVAQR
jgi:hypothetical protein